LSSQVKVLDHLFVGYAGEDAVFARWITLRLTAEGYKVWCDQFELLGGETYPENIRKEIKESLFRFLAVISKYSINKAMPLNERTLAMRVGIDRGIDDFIIPLNLDGSKASDLDLTTAAHTYIPFKDNWAAGLAQLLEKLKKIETPTRPNGREAVISWLNTQENYVEKKQEALWSNIVQVSKFPDTLYKYDIIANTPDSFTDNWPFYRQDNSVWAFGSPPKGASVVVKKTSKVVKWREETDADGIDTFDLVSSLLRQSLRNYSLRKGMKNALNGKDAYFPFRLLPNDKISYKRYDGRTVPVNTCGLRTVKTRLGTNEISYYHLAPTFVPLLSRFGDPTIQMNFRLVWTDSEGKELPGATKRRRLKWWNYDWLSRTLGVLSWLSGGAETVNLAENQEYALIMNSRPIPLFSQFHINEDRLTARPEEEDQTEVIEESSEEESEDEDQGKEKKD
jgi:hypothetical protein